MEIHVNQAHPDHTGPMSGAYIVQDSSRLNPGQEPYTDRELADITGEGEHGANSHGNIKGDLCNIDGGAAAAAGAETPYVQWERDDVTDEHMENGALGHDREEPDPAANNSLDKNVFKSVKIKQELGV